MLLHGVIELPLESFNLNVLGGHECRPFSVPHPQQYIRVIGGHRDHAAQPLHLAAEVIAQLCYRPICLCKTKNKVRSDPRAKYDAEPRTKRMPLHARPGAHHEDGRITPDGGCNHLLCRPRPHPIAWPWRPSQPSAPESPTARLSSPTPCW